MTLAPYRYALTPLRNLAFEGPSEPRGSNQREVIGPSAGKKALESPASSGIRLAGFGAALVDDFLSEIFDVLVSAAMPFFALLAMPLVGGLVIEVFGHYGKAERSATAEQRPTGFREARLARVI